MSIDWSNDDAASQLMILALAILSLDRPGWQDACASIADHVRPHGRAEMMEQRRLHEDRWLAHPPLDLDGSRR